MSERTPGPWRTGATMLTELILAFSGEKEVLIAELGADEDLTGEQHEANAEHIVRCVNAHDDLVKALTDLLKLYVDLVESGDAGFWDADKVSEVIAARAALLPVESRE